METLATARSIRAAQQRAVEDRVSEAAVEQLSRASFLEHIALSHAMNLVPFALIGVCCLALPNWRLMVALLGINALALGAMSVVTQKLRRVVDAAQSRRLWQVYEATALIAGVLWAGLMFPVIATLGRDMASTFVCVVVIVAIAITSMVVGSQWRIFLAYLIGVMACLIPQTLLAIAEIGPIPLAATLGLAPALVGLAHAVRRQNLRLIRTQLERQALADDLADALGVAEYLASRDSLTGLYNRRAFEDVANTMRAEAQQATLSLILVDLDHFKRINDLHGHAAGDAVLKSAAKLIERHLGPGDLMARGDGAVARWGGEEFILLLRSASIDAARDLAEALRRGLADLRDPAWPAEMVVTGSFGVAQWRAGDALHLGISKADEAMYRAKHGGRNRVCVLDRDAA